MKISWNHLQSFFSETLDKNLVLERLTMAGLEVEDESPVAPEFSGIKIGLVTDCVKHPDADKLSLCKVDVGSGELLQIICGASNVKTGVKIPCAVVGAVLPGNFKITERKMRGIVSYGMLCSGDELGCPNDVDGLWLFADDAPIGADVREYLDLNDTIVEFKITPNRGDCLSYLGLAREIQALTGVQLKSRSSYHNYLTTPSTTKKVTVSDTTACSHYIGLHIENVNNQISSPEWLVRLLARSNIRSISPVVDITNYVMLELGQPMHAFNSAYVANGINVRFAHQGEELKLLDNSIAKIATDTLVIASADDSVVALAGVMGGSESGVTIDTSSILLESAFFAPDTIQGKTKYYTVSSDSAFRFERGVDTQVQHDAINLAANLIKTICGGEVGDYIHYASSQHQRNSTAIKLTFNEIEKLIGEKISDNEIITILQNLGCQLEISTAHISVTPPSHRFDLNIKQDIIEEIIRVYGYDRIEAKLPNVLYTFNSLDERSEQLFGFKQTLVAHGLNEVVSYAFIEDKYASQFSDSGFDLIKLQNPIAGLNLMRNNLLPGLIKSLVHNVNRGHDRVRLFELARVFHGEDISQQPLYLASLVYGKISSLNWSAPARNVDFYDLRLVVEELLRNCGTLSFIADSTNAHCHPGRAAKIELNGIVVGYIGQLHPKYAQDLGLNQLPYVFELNLQLISAKNSVNLQAVSKHQKVSRDLAFVVDAKIAVGAIMQQIQQLSIAELIDVAVFDIFTGGNLPSNEKSVAINFIFQADKTLTDEDINPSLELIKKLVCEQFAAKLR